MTALAYGELMVVDGCIRLVDQGNATSYLLIWSDDHTTKDENGVLVIHDGAGQRVAQIGDWVTMGGGEDDRIEPITDTTFGLQEPTPPECPGPYWVMGNIESVGSPTPVP
ncbi:MAG TPA: hypothetical protein PKE20_05975 [Promineifilum sp.]|nr:hypothetical protein [Promineifilum sp.]